MSSTAFCGRILSAPKKMEKVKRKRKTDRDLYDVGVIEVDTTRKPLKIHFVGFSHEYDKWRDYYNERNYFPFVRLEKMFSPRKVRWRIEATFFTGDCIVASRESLVRQKR